MNFHAVFNKKLLDFADDLQNLKQDIGATIPEIDSLRPFVLLASTFDPSKPQQMFHEHVVSKYESQIARKDEQFFVEERYDEVASGGDAGGGGNIVDMLKRVWRDLSPDNKDAIWRHLHVLVTLNNRCRN
jgi:hypothetical protein